MKTTEVLHAARQRQHSLNPAVPANPKIERAVHEAMTEIVEVYGPSVCTSCLKPSLLIFKMPRNTLINHRAHLARDNQIISDDDAKEFVVEVVPKPTQPETDEAWPEKISLKISEAQRMVSGGFSPPTIISTCRTILELTIKELNGEGKTIFHRITDLKEKGIITGPISDWFHDIRKFGADATHDDEGTADDANAFVAFLLMMLNVAFTLPARIRRAREIA